MTFINLSKLVTLAQNNPEIKKLCAKNVPVYLLQMELGRYKFCLQADEYENLKKLKLK